MRNHRARTRGLPFVHTRVGCIDNNVLMSESVTCPSRITPPHGGQSESLKPPPGGDGAGIVTAARIDERLRSSITMWRESPLLDSSPSTEDNAESVAKLVRADDGIRLPVRGVASSSVCSNGSHVQISISVEGGVILHHGGGPVTSEPVTSESSVCLPATLMTQTINTTTRNSLLTESSESLSRKGGQGYAPVLTAMIAPSDPCLPGGASTLEHVIISIAPCHEDGQGVVKEEFTHPGVMCIAGPRDVDTNSRPSYKTRSGVPKRRINGLFL